MPSIPDPVGFAGPFAGVVGGALVVAGGANFPGGRPWDGHAKVWHDRVFVLRQPDGTWETGSPLPRPIAYGMSLTWRDQVVCLGGCDSAGHRADVFVMRFANGVISYAPLPALPVANAYGSAVLVGDIVYVAGGLEHAASPRPLHRFWSLDLANPEMGWRELEPWPGSPRMLAVMAAIGDDVFLFSGTDLLPDGNGKPQRSFLRDAYRYAPQTGWRRLADLPRSAIAAPTPAPTLDGRHVLIVGGDDGSNFFRQAELRDAHPGFCRDVLGYDPSADGWLTAQTLPAATFWTPVTTPAVPWRGGIILPSGEIRPGVRTPRILRMGYPAGGKA